MQTFPIYAHLEAASPNEMYFSTHPKKWRGLGVTAYYVEPMVNVSIIIGTLHCIEYTLSPQEVVYH